MSQKQVIRKVEMLNFCFPIFKRMFETEHALFQTFSGNSIFKVDGSLKKKYAHDLPKQRGLTPSGYNYMISSRLNEYNYSVDFFIEIQMWGADDLGGNFNLSYSKTIKMSEKDRLSGVLSSCVIDLSSLDRKFDIDALNKVAAEAEEAKLEYQKKFNAMSSEFRDLYGLRNI